MVSLYSCKHDGDIYSITKFDDQLNVESSYLVDPTACQCPAFDKRGRCKHQEMLPFFINRKAVGSGEMYDHERGGWVRMFEDPEPVPPLPAGVTMISLDDPVLVHNTIAEAIGEPPLQPPAPRPASAFRRR